MISQYKVQFSVNIINPFSASFLISGKLVGDVQVFRSLDDKAFMNP
jgi:hypothetical protein